MKFKKMKRFLRPNQDVIEINIRHIYKAGEVTYYRNEEIYKLLYTKTKYDDYPVIAVYGYNVEGYNGIAVELRCLDLEVDK